MPLQKATLKKLIDVAAGRQAADLVLTNGRIVDVFSRAVRTGDVAVVDGRIAGIADHYDGQETVDLAGKYLLPGLIDAHIHIESAYVTPEEFGRLFVPHGTTTIATDPHEIVNVFGMGGLQYMEDAAKQTPLDVRFMMPPCVPSTPFETAGAHLTADDMAPALKAGTVDGLAELMNYVGVVNNDDQMLDEVLAAKAAGKRIDGHAPALMGKLLNAYAAAGAQSDHECMTVEEAQARLAAGMYLMLREGTTEHNLVDLLGAVTPANSRRCILVGDDIQAKTVLSSGHLDHSLRLAVSAGCDPLLAIQMATLNAAEYCQLPDRGAIAPGRRADLVVVDNLRDFTVERVYIEGSLTAQDNEFLPEVHRVSTVSVNQSMFVQDFKESKLALQLTGKPVRTIQVLPGQVAAEEKVVNVAHDASGNFVFDPKQDVNKVAVVERHHRTGRVAVGLLSDYGIKEGAIATSIAHDSHNLIVAGVSDAEMAAATEALIAQGGGAVVVKNGKVMARLELPVAGLMSDQPGEVVVQEQGTLDAVAHQELGIPTTIDPVMTLSFMSLAVIPKLKLTDRGLFDVAKMEFVPLEVE